MPDGGRIKITVGTSWDLTEDGPRERAVIEFSDTGCGIPEAIRERIFEPFFTTKAVDKGTGLGLSQVYGFVQQSNGTITVSSRIGAGATFRMVLPTCAETPRPKSAELAEERSRAVGGTTVLLVEDHPDVSFVAADYLEHTGCNVVHANSAEAAIEILNNRRDIGLVLSDIVMPGMSGLEFGRLVREYHPEIPVILASGYSDKAAVAQEEGFTLIQKPYSPEALEKVIVAALDGVRKIKTLAGS